MPHLSSIQAAQFLTMPFRKHKQRYVINPPDELHTVTYLGNVLTILAKGDQSIERPLSAIWRSYTTRKRDVPMKLTVTRSGLKVETKQLGITEYWAHRITYCYAPPEYPRVFCWVYKHEGKRMKPELRCHAVLCKKQSEPAHIVSTLTGYLQAALQEYKREKLTMEKARKNSVTSGGCPRRKLILQTGTLNFRPPVNRSKSAPRLGSIDEEDEQLEMMEAEKGEDIESMSDFEYDEGSDLDSLGYRGTPLIGDTHHYPITTALSLTYDQLSQASTSSNSTASAPTTSITASKSFDSQYTSELPNDLKLSPKNFPKRQLSLSSANRKRLQPNKAKSMEERSTSEEKFDKVLNIDGTEAKPEESRKLSEELSSIVLEEDELVVESSNSCASSDDGFGSSCHEGDITSKIAKSEECHKVYGESDFLSDDSANESDHVPLRTEVEVTQIRRMLLASQQVTAL